MKLKEYLKTVDSIYHTTLDPNGPGVVRIHLIPPKKLKVGVPFVAVINGYHVLPLQTSWAILLIEFINEVNKTNGKVLSEEKIEKLLKTVTGKVKLLFKDAKQNDIASDLAEMIKSIRDIASGKEPTSEIGVMTLAYYSKFMKAPHRMDLMISSMERDGKFYCNQRCLHCYACGEKMANVNEIDTEAWKNIINKCKEAGIPSLTFTGGEPTLRKDLVELVEHSKWFVTRLNTNGILLSEELCKNLYKASLDSVQVTLYSYDKDIHNELVGGNHFDETIQGIKNAVAAGLDVSVNTPLCSKNSDYVNTVVFASKLGVKFFSCSGLIPSGNATKEASKIIALSKHQILSSVKDAYNYARGHELEITFTSPGWIEENNLMMMKMQTPSCGACLSNMAIAPNGTVLPCQSWLFEDGLGNMLTDEWKSIWNSKKCKERRLESSKNEQRCPLRKEDDIL